MILIISDQDDQFSNEIVDLLIFNKIEHQLIRTGIDKLSLVKCNPNYFKLLINDKIILTSDTITGVYYRRDSLQVDAYNTANIKNDQLLNYCKSENKAISDYINFLLKKYNKCIGNPFKLKINKLVTLDIAEDCGFNVPDFLITSKKIEAIQFYNKYCPIITKSINTQTFFSEIDSIKAIYTTDISLEDLKQLNNTFPTTFFQKKIDKIYDIRSFYLNKTVYSMAILSQENQKTSTDFRKYDKKFPNRRLSIDLPQNIKDKLVKFHERININCSSVDLLLDKKGDYYFLEINPVGQHHMVGVPLKLNINNLIINEFKK